MSPTYALSSFPEQSEVKDGWLFSDFLCILSHLASRGTFYSPAAGLGRSATMFLGLAHATGHIMLSQVLMGVPMGYHIWTITFYKEIGQALWFKATSLTTYTLWGYWFLFGE